MCEPKAPHQGSRKFVRINIVATRYRHYQRRVLREEKWGHLWRWWVMAGQCPRLALDHLVAHEVRHRRASYADRGCKHVGLQLEVVAFLCLAM